MRLSDIKKSLSECDLALSKKLGQHLLVDENVRRRFVEEMRLSRDAVVIEIGPGTGLLTESIVEKAGFTFAIEIDRGLAEMLKKRFAENPGIRIVHQDITTCDFAKMLAEVTDCNGGLSFVGNLPYNLHSPIVSLITESGVPFVDCVFIIQKEMAGRYMALPGSKLYSVISIYVQYHYSVEKLFDIDYQCFYPVPKVVSSAIRLVPHKVKPVQAANEDLFFRVVRTAFGQRRKMLRNTLGTLTEAKSDESVLPRAFAVAGVDPEIRPERVSIKEFAALANALSKAR